MIKQLNDKWRPKYGAKMSFLTGHFVMEDCEMEGEMFLTFWLNDQSVPVQKLFRKKAKIFLGRYLFESIKN